MVKLLFHPTQNVKLFRSVARSLICLEAGVPGLALVHGARGLGKTKAAQNLAATSSAIYVRAKRTWSPTWMLDELAVELGIPPRNNLRYLFQSLVSSLKDEPRLIMIDECNLPELACLETLRDIHDLSESPFLLMGHEGVVHRLKRMPPLFDRLLYISEFKPFSVEDLTDFANTILDVPATEQALSEVLRITTGNIRKAVVVLKGAETRAKATRASQITVDHLPRR